MDNFQKNLQILIGKKRNKSSGKAHSKHNTEKYYRKAKKFSIKTKQALKLKKSVIKPVKIINFVDKCY